MDDEGSGPDERDRVVAERTLVAGGVGAAPERPSGRQGCPDDETFARLLDGELDEQARAALEEHLDRCSGCRRLVAEAASGSTRTSRTRVSGRGRSQPVALEDTTAPTWTPLTARVADQTPPFASGDAVDHYRIERPLGRGGMGQVYVATDTKLQRRVALKMVSPELVVSATMRERFIREARATARLNHPNIVTIHAVGEHLGVPYLALEYVKGRTMRGWLASHPERSLADVLDMSIAVADALAAAHADGVLHRDLKPDNVLIDGTGRVRVVDFGLAELVESERPAASERAPQLPAGPIVTGVAGTPAYMAPEQWADRPCSGATDVWALGIIMFQMLSGRHPFERAAETLDLLQLVVEPKEVEPLAASTERPRVLCELVSRCLRKDPAARPSAAEVAAALRAVRQTVATARPRGRARVVAAAGALVALGIAAGAIALRDPATSPSDRPAAGSHRPALAADTPSFSAASRGSPAATVATASPAPPRTTGPGGGATGAPSTPLGAGRRTPPGAVAPGASAVSSAAPRTTATASAAATVTSTPATPEELLKKW